MYRQLRLHLKGARPLRNIDHNIVAHLDPPISDVAQHINTKNSEVNIKPSVNWFFILQSFTGPLIGLIHL